MKKIALALATIAFGASAFAADVTFYNKVYEDDYMFKHIDKEYRSAYFDENDSGETNDDFGTNKTHFDFPQLKNEMSVEYKSEHVDASITAVAALDDYDSKHFGLDGYIDDWYIEYRFVMPLTIGLHDDIWMDGSYLPIYDDNVAGGNIGSEGFTAVYRPTFFENKLRIAASLPFELFTKTEDDLGKSPNWLYKCEDDDEEHDDRYVDLNLGAIYDNGLFQVGISVQDVLDNDNRVFGSYFSLPNLFGFVDGLTIGGGYTHYIGVNRPVKNDSFAYSNVGHPRHDDRGFNDLTWFGGINGNDLVSANLTFEKEDFPVSVAADFLYNLNEEYFEPLTDNGGNSRNDASNYNLTWDLYTAFSVTFGITDQLSATVGGKLLIDTSRIHRDDAVEYGFYQERTVDNVYGLNVNLDFQLDDHNSFGAGFEWQTYDDNYKYAIPLYWQWDL